MNDENSELRDAGLKVTAPRLKILNILESSIESHLSADDIYRQLIEAGEDVGIATVYRVLTQFETAGLVMRHNFDNGPAVYEIERGGHHDHMVDVDSGKVVEFHSAEIEELQKSIAVDNGFELVCHSLVLYVRKK
ncbi:MAG: ferric iron uptake transcriptional regulator [Porticoccus sp.]|jgi:Fur family ferric uptake transcriptional regulator|uniref:ferric iron uptake transcriptional regulator n=1 Tax=Porticoccus sp. Uisw_050_02 TaxID=3230978 RepID=UPI001DCD1304|nr:ferric iron uptake transcriptional regulator [Porticoccus sp.]|tara:strand:+ start:3820 stop:4224 length:405 start_codon:yes stop_codon:yes gene_type:complete